jgi:hypothetical protein
VSRNPLHYKPAASETDEGKKRLQDYYTALGRFIDVFAKVELAVGFTLWHYAKTPYPVARVAFSATGLDAAMSSIKQLFKVIEIPQEKQNEINWLFSQLSSIKKVRNDILHYGAINVPEGDAAITNAAKALTRDRVDPDNIGLHVGRPQENAHTHPFKSPRKTPTRSFFARNVQRGVERHLAV